GGSLGAVALNDLVPQALALLPADSRPAVTHQSGSKHLERLRANYAAAGVDASIVAFIDDMAQAYAAADLVIARARATTVAELAAAGVAAILVPFPFAVDDHQTTNARYLADAGAAILVQQPDLRPVGLAATLPGLPRQRLLATAKKARARRRRRATRGVADACVAVAK